MAELDSSPLAPQLADTTNHINVDCLKNPPSIGPHCKQLGISFEWLNGSTGSSKPLTSSVTNGVIIELLILKKKHNYSLDQCANWVKILFNLKEAPQPKTVHSQWTRISKRATELRRNKLNYNIYINSPYTPPDSATKSTDLTHNKQTNTINISSSEKSVECTILPLSTKTETKSSQTNILHSTIEMEATQLGQNLNLLKKEIKESQIQFNKIKLRKGHYSIRNINKRDKRAKQKNNELSREVRELKNKLLKLEVQKRNAVKMTSKWRRKAQIVNKLECPKCLEKDIKIINLNDSVRSLESEIDIAPICISDTESEQKNKKRTELNFKEVRDGHIGYSDNIRLLYMRLLSLGIPVSKCSDVVHSVLTGLTDLKFGKLPSKGTTSLIQSECEVAGQIQVADILLHGNNMTLQLDGTKKKFNEYGAYQVTLNNASGQKETYSLGMKEMLKGDTDSFIDTMLSVFRDLAETFSDDSEQINEIRTKMLANIKNLMTDRHIVNKSFKIKFEGLRAELFDKYLKNFSTLSNQSKNQVVELNSLFCALHVIGNMGTVASKALKVYESIVLPPENKITEHSFDKGNARTFDLIFELSQSLTISGSQRVGRFTDWEAFLEERNIHNFLVSFLRHRFNILFVNGGAAFYHREHIAEFFHCLTAPNKLMKCISESIISPVCVAECRALGIFGVLISQPLWKIVERDIHVLDLNPYWLKLKNALSEYSVDASNLLKGKQLFSEFAMQEDEVYVSLFVPLTDEIQKFTQECLQIICFHVLQLVNRQLMDQLPNGLYFNATDTVRNETQSCPTTNRLGEKDFSDLDREVNRAPQRNTSNISGIICFRNNNAWKFYRNMNPEKRKLCLKRALRLAPKRYSKNKAHRKQLKKKPYQFIMEKKSKRQEADNKKQKQILEISEHVKENGLWNSKTIKQNIQSIDSTNAKIKSVKQQLKYHQTILHSKADKTLFLYSVNGKPHSLEQLIQNLNQVITFETNNEELEEISSSINANTKFRCESQRKLLINNIIEKTKSVPKKVNSSSANQQVARKIVKKSEKRKMLATSVPNKHLKTFNYLPVEISSDDKDSFVAIAYEDRWYLGQITHVIDKSSVTVSFMKQVGHDLFKWPSKPETKCVETIFILIKELSIEPKDSGLRIWKLSSLDTIEEKYNYYKLNYF